MKNTMMEKVDNRLPLTGAYCSTVLGVFFCIYWVKTSAFIEGNEYKEAAMKSYERNHKPRILFNLTL